MASDRHEPISFHDTGEIGSQHTMFFPLITVKAIIITFDDVHHEYDSVIRLHLLERDVTPRRIVVLWIFAHLSRSIFVRTANNVLKSSSCVRVRVRVILVPLKEMNCIQRSINVLELVSGSRRQRERASIRFGVLERPCESGGVTEERNVV